MSTLTKTYETITGYYKFIFEYPYPLNTGFDIVSLGEQSFGYEDQDEISIFPATFKFTITDFDWLNFPHFKKAIDNTVLTSPDGSRGAFYFPITVTIYNGEQKVGRYAIDDVERNYEDYTLEITLSSGIEKLKEINVNNPYLVRRLQAVGHLKPEEMRLMRKNNDDEWYSQFVGSDLAGAFGEIKEYSGVTGLGFTAWQTGTNVFQMHVSPDDPFSYGSSIVGNPAIATRVTKMIGQMKAMDFIKECAALINPDIQLTIDNNIRFGNRSTSLTAKIEDIWITKIYRLIFGRVVVLRKSFYNLYINKANPFLRNIDVSNNGIPSIEPDENNPYGIAMVMTPTKIWDDENYIAWELTGYGFNGTGDKSISGSLKDFCKSFLSGLDFQDLDKAIFYKRTYQQEGFPNPFGDGDGFGEGNIISLRKRTVSNRKEYVKISYLGGAIIAERGRFTPYEDRRLEYDLKYSAQEGSSYTVSISGFSGGISFPGSAGQIVSGPGSYIQASAPDQGNIFYFEGDTVRYATKVIDSKVPDETKLNRWVAACEYANKKENRPNYDITAYGIDYAVNKVYQISNPDGTANELTKVRPTEVRINRETNQTQITAIEVL